jgi:pyruvate dehydrogenase E1 component
LPKACGGGHLIYHVAGMSTKNPDLDQQETSDWLESLDAVIDHAGPERAEFLLKKMIAHGYRRGAVMPFTAKTPYVNTIPVSDQPEYPGDLEIEKQIEAIVRWNAMAMVVRANRADSGIGGHISTFASAATLYEVAFNHYFRASTANTSGDIIYFQGHASPGIYARAFLEGRIGIEKLHNFRRELAPGGGLSSYPHPWLMPDFWQFPTVSMGLAPISAIYQARFNRYLRDRGLCDTEGSRVWAFLGDGETDEPETLGAITLASREGLDNLTFVINCNLQRLDGPVRGNGKIIQELEGAFRGAGWNVLKVVWGSNWDPLLDEDSSGLLVQRMNESVDGEYQKFKATDGAFVRENFFGKYPELREMVAHMSDDEIWRLRRGGHDPVKINAAYANALSHKGAPTVILAKTIKGYGLGEAGEGRNITHQQKKLNEDELRHFRDRFDIPISDKQLAEAPFYHPGEKSELLTYLRDRRAALGGAVPSRKPRTPQVTIPQDKPWHEFDKGSGSQEASTTMVFVRILSRLLADKNIGKLIVPIVPDEARTFGLDALFRKYGIYSHQGQLYEPVDSHVMLYYRESIDGQILEEGITEAGSMASFGAAGTAYSTHGIGTIPMYMFYSMFGFQRVGDSIWQAADMRSRGFLLGCTAGRTTLAGEGLQHQDGHSLLHASTVPNCVSYDPAFAYEVATITREGLRRMCEEQEDIIYYITLENEPYLQPAKPANCDEGILRGMYQVAAPSSGDEPQIHLFGSGAILPEALRAQAMLADEFNVQAAVWSITSYTELKRDASECERWNRLNVDKTPRTPYLLQALSDSNAPIVAATDYVRALSDQIAPYLNTHLVSLGTDGFGRSENRTTLRRFFEVDAAHIAHAAVSTLVRQGTLDKGMARKAADLWNVDTERSAPWHS